MKAVRVLEYGGLLVFNDLPTPTIAGDEILWDRDRREEVDLLFYLTRAAWPHLKQSHGVIVNTGSLNGFLSFTILPSLAHTTAKAGVIAMTRQLAMEGREHGIRANSISPGLIETNRRRSNSRIRNGQRRCSGRRFWVVSVGRKKSRTSPCFSPRTKARTSPASTSSPTVA